MPLEARAEVGRRGTARLHRHSRHQRAAGTIHVQRAISGQTTGASAGYQGGVADLLLGLPTQYSQDSNTVFHQSQNMYFFFAQDDWKATSRLTLNAGVRYEFATPAARA